MPPGVARLFLAVWIACYLIYPFWFFSAERLTVAANLFAALCLAAAGLIFYLRPILFSADPLFGRGRWLRWVSPPRDWVVWLLLSALLLTRVFALRLPITGAGDEDAQLALAALPFKVWALKVPLSHVGLVWALAAFIWLARKQVRDLMSLVGTLLYHPIGDPLGPGGRRASRRPRFRPGPVICVITAAVAASAYFYLVFNGLARFTAGRPELVADLHRFSPLAKWIRVAAYGFLGVSEFAGRLPEFLFYAGGGFFVYKTAALFGTRLQARLAVALFWLLPPVAYFGIKGSQACGELFFYAGAAYFFAMWLKGAGLGPLYWAFLSVSLGFMYHGAPPVVAFAMAVGLCLGYRKTVLRLKDLTLHHVLELIGMAAVMIGPWMVVGPPGPMPPASGATGLLSMDRFLLPAYAVIGSAGAPVVLLLAAGMLGALVGSRDDFKRFLMIWFVGFYLVLALREAGDVRWALPMCLPLVLWSGEGLVRLTGGRALSAVLGLAVCAGLMVHGTWASLSRVRPEFSLRRGASLESLPLEQAAGFLNALPKGTRVGGLDCDRDRFGLYLDDPRGIEWVPLSSTGFSTLRDLGWALFRKRVDMLVYFENGPPGEDDDSLMGVLRRAPDVPRTAEFSMGRNKIVVADVR